MGTEMRAARTLCCCFLPPQPSMSYCISPAFLVPYPSGPLPTLLYVLGWRDLMTFPVSCTLSDSLNVDSTSLPYLLIHMLSTRPSFALSPTRRDSLYAREALHEFTENPSQRLHFTLTSPYLPHLQTCRIEVSDYGHTRCGSCLDHQPLMLVRTALSPLHAPV